MVGQMAQDRINCEIKFKICNIMFLYSKERWITTISTRLQEVKPAYDKGQDIIILNWESDRQAQECQIL